MQNKKQGEILPSISVTVTVSLSGVDWQPAKQTAPKPNTANKPNNFFNLTFPLSY